MSDGHDSTGGAGAALNRRAFLAGSTGGISSLALGGLLTRDGLAADGVRDFAPRARRVIFLTMAGGPSQLESFDEKPELARWDGEPMPESYTAGQPIAQLQGFQLKCMGPRVDFRSWGESGQRISTYFPHIGGIADRIAIVRSMHTDQINHDPAHTVMNTGTSISGRPSMGSWVTYGLGHETQDLPGFVVLVSKGGRNPQPLSTRQWHSGFLPGRYQGVQFRGGAEPVPYVDRPPGVDETGQRRVVDTAAALNGLANEVLHDPELETRVRAYELAFRMQTSVPDLLDLSDESEETLELYGLDPSLRTGGFQAGSFAANALLARRLVERGVRFVQLYHRGWDHHNDIDKFMGICSGLTDQGSAALVQDLERRGLLEDTLVVWTGEFGRTPMVQTNKGGPGRDHHMRAFSLWMAGGGIRGGVTHGETDELGYHVGRDPVHVNDLHATMLHLLGMNHERLTWRYRGRDFRLTDVAGEVIRPILA